MNVYQTDLNGVYIGITIADQDPLDSTNWLIPAGCVETAPPTMTDSQFATWNGTEWVVEDIPVVEPNPEPEPIAPEVLVRAERYELLETSDWTQVDDSPVDKSAWATYRQLLRDVPQQSGFPNTISWPEKPV
mgnify:FL=1|tara:strand:+ start:259 stop:654 length:396 start_codon:yes stop_codon:yes gene_type:complete